MAKWDGNGNLVTSRLDLKKLYLETYTDRLSHREIKSELRDIYHLKTQLWCSRLTTLEKIKTKDWSWEELHVVLSNLKNNKSPDPMGIVNEVFKPGNIGSDLELSLLYLFNSCKANQRIPKHMTFSNITSIHKNKGSRLSLEIDRGIFIQTILKKVLDKLIYFDLVNFIDLNMTDSNIGARRKRNIRDHLYIF